MTLYPDYFRNLLRRGTTSVFLLIALVGLAGCGGQLSAPVWPGLVVADDMVYLASPDGRVRALDAGTGKLLWEYPPTEEKPLGLYTSLAVSGDLLLAGSYLDNAPNGLYALGKADGKHRWSFATGGPIAGAATVEGSKAFVGSSDHKLYCIDIASGTPCWESPFEAGQAIWASPLLVKDGLFAVSMDHKLYSLDAKTGKRQWEFKAGGAMAGTPALGDDTVYIGAFDGKLYAVDASSGQERWAFQASGWVWGGPVFADGKVYFGDLGGKVYALDAATRDLIWELELEGRVRATPAYDGQTLYVGTEKGHLYALDPANGQKRWDFTVPAADANSARVLTQPVFEKDTVFSTSIDGTVYALDAAKGTQRWVYVPRSEAPTATPQPGG
jgi:outer membrane protein assembly factor BamB